MVLIIEILVAVSLPLWLVIEQVVKIRRQRRHVALVAARRRSRHAAVQSFLERLEPRGLDPRVRRADHPRSG